MNRIVVSKFTSLWKLMSEHTFIIDPDSIHEDLMCMLCRKLMIDACQTPCSCQFCYQCICDYLSDGEKFCPGHKSECKVEFLILQRDVLKDPKTNNKIFNSKVLCPNQLCQTKMELSEMECHMTICMKQSNNSADVEEDRSAILDHINNTIFNHTESLMNNIKNEFDGFKESLERNRIEIESLKETRDTHVGEIQNLKSELRTKESRIVFLEDKLAELQRERLIDKQITIAKASELQTRLYEQIYNQDADIADAKNSLGYKINNLERKLIYYSRCNYLCPNIDVDFIWIFFNVNGNNVVKQFSDPFYCNCYRFVLCMEFMRDKISLMCYLVPGTYDDKVQWPMADQVTLSIVDQDTMKPFRSESYQYESYYYKYKWVFNRPRDGMNGSGIGSYSFAPFSTISDNPSIVVNDSIVVSCNVDSNIINCDQSDYSDESD